MYFNACGLYKTQNFYHTKISDKHLYSTATNVSISTNEANTQYSTGLIIVAFCHKYSVLVISLQVRLWQHSCPVWVTLAVPGQ